MTLFKDRFRIETIRLPEWDYSARGWYFVTTCTQNKECTLGSAVAGRIVLSRAGVIAEEQMQAIPNHYSNVALDHFVIMPNHVHAIIVIEGEHVYSPMSASSEQLARRPSLGNIVGAYKAGVTWSCRAEGMKVFAWQTRFYEHILRSNATDNAARDYIDRNPENWLEDSYYPGHKSRKAVW